MNVAKMIMNLYLGVPPCPIFSLSSYGHPLPPGQIHLENEFLWSDFNLVGQGFTWRSLFPPPAPPPRLFPITVTVFQSSDIVLQGYDSGINSVDQELSRETSTQSIYVKCLDILNSILWGTRSWRLSWIIQGLQRQGQPSQYQKDTAIGSELTKASFP